MFEISFTKKDLVRSLWAFLFGSVTYLATMPDASVADWKAVASGALLAGLVALKNLVLKDGTLIKG